MTLKRENQIPHRLVLLGEACPPIKGVDVIVGGIGLPIDIPVKCRRMNAIAPHSHHARRHPESRQQRLGLWESGKDYPNKANRGARLDKVTIRQQRSRSGLSQAADLGEHPKGANRALGSKSAFVQYTSAFEHETAESMP